MLSGFTLFAAKAHTYFANTNFEIKMMLAAAAFLNMLVFHLIPYRSVASWDLAAQRHSSPSSRVPCP